MFLRRLTAIAMLVATAVAAPAESRLQSHQLSQPKRSDTPSIVVSTVFATATLNLPATIYTTLAQSLTEVSSSGPTYTATQLYAYREDSPIHLLPIQARGLYFQLGGLPTTACPSNVKDCPPGVITGMNQCELSVEVPGGQQIYLKPDGSLRFTASHSMAMAPGSIQCPITYKGVGDDVSEAYLHGFGASGFMACPMVNSTNVPEQWQVYVNTSNASVPILNGTASSCLEFEAFGVKFDLGKTPAAYGYL